MTSLEQADRKRSVPGTSLEQGDRECGTPVTPSRPGRKEQEYPIVTSVEQANKKKGSKNNQDMIVLDVCCRGKIGLSVQYKKKKTLYSGTQGGWSPLSKCITQDPNAEEHWYDRNSNHVRSGPNKTNLTPEIN